MICYKNLATPKKTIRWVQGSDHGFVPQKSEVVVWTTKKPAAKKPAVKKAPARKPAAKKPAVKKAPAKKPAAKKPAVKNPTTPQENPPMI
jgi:hypothetical protein